MVPLVNKSWMAEHDRNYQKLLAMRRRQKWMALMIRIELQWYEGWRGSLADDRATLSPWQPWTYDWGTPWT